MDAPLAAARTWVCLRACVTKVSDDAPLAPVHAEPRDATSRDEEGGMEYLGLGGGGSLGLVSGGSLGLARRGVDVAAKLFSTDGFCAVSA